MYDFDYHKPKSLDDAAKLLSKHDDFKLLAGGMSLIPALKLRLARHAGLVDLGALGALKGIRRDGGALVIGAMTPHAEVAASAEVARSIPALAVLAGGIGDPLVRNRGTMGGSIANADPAADYPAGVLGLGATVVTHRREIAADVFFLGLFETALEPGEIITAVRFPIPDAAAYCKFPQPASRFALAGVFVARTAGGVRVAVTGAGPSVFRFPEAEAALSKRFDPAALDGIALGAGALNSDIHASAEYRAHCVAVMAKRAVLKAREAGAR
ncbi:MAG: xanthine dehydrogenase family protein subunit M [Betaproteobacteria bacterium]|nr:xanthine dehydrogenase family protein subunit M [Betaproteobacteria bacterium]